MSDELNTAVKALESKLDERVKMYEGQVSESGEAVKSLRDEVKGLSEDYAERLKELEQNSVEGYKSGQQSESIGKTLVKSDSFSEFQKGNGRSASIEFKNSILESATPGVEPGVNTVDQLAAIRGMGDRPLTILDMVPTGSTSQGSIRYPREASRIINAAETAQGAKFPESEMTFENVTDDVKTVGHYLRMSNQLLEDAPAVGSFVDKKLMNGLRQRVQKQILVGDGTGENLSGFALDDRHTAFAAESGESMADAINRAKYSMIDADKNPTHIVMNGLDWSDLETEKTSTKAYKNGNTQVSYANNGLQPRLWTLPVIANAACPRGTFYVIDSSEIMIFTRANASVELFRADADNATRNLVTAVASMRAAFIVFAKDGVISGSFEAPASGS